MQNATSSHKQTIFISPFEVSPSEERASRRKETWAKARAILREWGKRYRVRSRLRRQLREMDTYLAEKDVGLPIGSLVEEAGKPFWRA